MTIFSSDYTPDPRKPVIVSMVNALVEEGYLVHLSNRFWDFTAQKGDNEPEIALKSVGHNATTSLRQRVIVDNVPMKVIIYEDEGTNLDLIKGQTTGMAMFGVGTYVKGYGWVTYPYKQARLPNKLARLRYSKNWTEVKPGIFEKPCRVCGEIKGPEAFYEHGVRGRRDPHRNQCIPCFLGGQKTPSQTAAPPNT